MNGALDEASTKKATEVLRQQSGRLRELAKSAVALGKPSAKERERGKQLDQEWQNTTQQTVQATKKFVSFLQTGKVTREIALQAAQATADYGQAMTDFAEQTKAIFE
jgi:hypothetical protein